jgi:hypothetical protein
VKSVGGSVKLVSKLKDSHIRAALRAKLSSRVSSGSFLVDELGLCEGEVFVDVAIVARELEGFEIKSDVDSLKRLERQSAAYSRVLNRASVVVTERHLDFALDAVPDWWGVLLAFPNGESAKLTIVRKPKRNPAVDSFALAQLLWRDEVLAQLQMLGRAKGFLSRPRRELWERLVEELSVRQLQQVVCDQLRRREGWRSVAKQVQCDDSRLLEPRS